ncbi:MAG: hypothetical protein QG635_706, partial [Bacteroidota bacterium]|nr:hypothetical protein [Bacteroidota bacterium]
FYGGNMHRLLRLSLFVIMLCVFIFNDATAQYKAQVFVSGRIGPDDVRVFLKDSVYVIDRDLLIAGTLLIEPGTSVYFYPQGRIIDSVGGRIIADGFAKAHYDKNPLSNNGVPINPVEPPGPYNPYSWDIGYATLDYFLFEGSNGRTIQVNTVQEQSVNRAKYNHIFNVVLDKDIREIRNLTNPLAAPGGNKVIVPFEKAIIFYAARMNVDPESDVNLKNRSWERVNEGNQNLKNVDIGTGSDARGENVIKFIGQPMNNFSREWGHIIILPGARTAFFRNCSFNSFRKDTTVDRKAMYNEITENSSWNWPLTDRKMVNNKLRMLTNGSGGVITTFSSRTWLINCDFTDNMARLKGGALAVFQAPYGYPMDKNYSLNSYYLKDKNPNITDPEGNISSVNMKGSIDPNYTAIPAIDYIDETTAEPTFNVSDPTQADYYRQAYDDGRIAMYLGRMRNLKFMNNKVLLADVEEVTIPGNPPIKYIGDVETANYPYEYGNLAYGGAIYLASSKDVNQREIEVGLGVNQYMKINQSQTSLTFTHDEFVCTGNRAINYQASTNNDSYGARGGAIYIGKNTSLIVAGQVDNNEAHAYNLIDNTTEPNRGFFALGGAIFAEKTYGRLQVRGGPTRDQGTRKNQTEFIGNKAGAGGAIYVDDNQSNLSNYKSPIIGGTDETVNTRDYGYYIRFMDNDASSFGGAIYTKRNMSVYGAGGVVAGSLVGYGGKFPVLFENNTAGYAGGAIDLRLPYDTDISPIDRTVQVIRALFRGNEVAASGIADANKPKIRGGGAIYSLNASINVVKAVEFDKNKVYNGNGGAIAMVHPQTSSKRFFLSDLDQLTVDKNTNMFNGFNSENEVFTFGQTAYPPDTRMLTRFFGNEIEVEPAILASQSGSGTTQIGKGSLGTTENLYGASFLTDNSGYAVGSNGIICKITNGGSI